MANFSVVIASVNGLPSIAECMRSVNDQRGDVNVEVVVVDATRDGTTEFIGRSYPEVKLIKLENRPGIPEMRAIGMRHATGDFLVITEDHCIVPSNWIEEFQKAHLAGYAVVGGAVENGSTRRLIDWAVFLCEYSGFMQPLWAGESEFVAGNNVSYQRDVLVHIEDTIKNDFWEYFLQVELRKNGIKFLSKPAVEIIHKKEFGFFYFLSQRFHYSRSFAAMRSKKSTNTKKLIYLVYAPLSVFHLTWRVIVNVLRKKRHRKELLVSFPFLALFMCSYAIGELVGQLFGPGDSLKKVE